MKLKQIFLIGLLFAAVFSGCRKIEDNPEPQSGQTMKDLVIPAGFEWASYADVTLSVGVETSQSTQAVSRITVFKGDPANGGMQLVSGSVSPDNRFTTTLRIPAYLESVYLQCEFPFGNVKTVAVPAAKSIDYTFSESTDQGMKSGFKGSNEIGPDCGEDCDETISGTGTYFIGGGETFCVTETFNGNITFNGWDGGGTLQVCGDATITDMNFADDSHIIVTQNGTLTINNFTGWGSTGTITVYENATLIVNDNFRTAGDYVENQGMIIVNGGMKIQNLETEFINSGILNITGDVEINKNTVVNSGTITANGSEFALNTQATLENSGTLILESNTANTLETNSQSSLINNGTIDVTGDIDINSGSLIRNNCAMICSGTFDVNSGDFEVYSGFLKGGETINLNQNNSVSIYDGSMISTVDLFLNSGGIEGFGNLNSVLVTGTFTIYNNNEMEGAIEAATDDLYITNGGIPDHFINGATVVGLDEITNYIAPGNCNPDGIGEPEIIDTDGDGVPDSSDDYPEDVYRAFNNYFPSEDSYATIMFEDLWPSTGDYDFNDLVLGVYGNEITNASNDVVEIDINFDVRAVGASFENGFGWQFANIEPSDIQQVTGAVLLGSGETSILNNANGTEQDQDSAVIIAVENIESVLNRVGGSMFNTMDNGLVGTSDLIQINILFGETTPISRDLIGPSAYNAFLIKNQNREVEIHLPNRQPTDNMNTALLGTGNDVSDPFLGTFYKTETGLPWGLLIIEPVDYPIEAIPIIEAFPDFANWAQSGGTANQDWYTNPISTKVWTP